METTDQPISTAPTCPDCHALVSDLGAHTEWHRRVVSDIAKAVERYSDRRAATPGT